tara:strand:- start:874 stop:2115 length:1242 start_codon:yes stop_codon:yes gene_type:complete
MKLVEIYNQKKNNFLFSDSSKFVELRDKLIAELNFSEKNNESIKHIDPKALSFEYKYKDIKNEISFLENKEDNIKINVVDGKVSTTAINKQNKFKFNINNIESNNNSICNKFLFYQNFFKKDYILNINSLFLNSGYEIIISENQEVNIIISNSVSEENLTIFQKNFIKCLDKCRVNIIEEYSSDKTSNNNIVNFIDICKEAEVNHFIIQSNKQNADLQSTSFTNCGENSKYNQIIINISKASMRNHHYANIIGAESMVKLEGIFLASTNQIVDNKTQINHQVPNANSNQCYKGILADNAKASYLSKTLVDKEAQKTEAYQLSKGILLSDNSFFHSKPELKIYADDVKCSHGSTIGPIDHELLFYLRSRGLSKKESISLLIKSFFHSIINQIDDQKIIDRLNLYSNNWILNNIT